MRIFLWAMLGAAFLAPVYAATIPVDGADSAQSCTDSWANDGHSKPWYTASTQKLHGNSVHISCPSSSTAWAVDYFVFKHQIGGNIFFPINIQNKQGHGSFTFSASVSPIGCNAGWLYGTQVYNHVTGGNITKPNVNGQAIC